MKRPPFARSLFAGPLPSALDRPVDFRASLRATRLLGNARRPRGVARRRGAREPWPFEAAGMKRRESLDADGGAEREDVAMGPKPDAGVSGPGPGRGVRSKAPAWMSLGALCACLCAGGRAEAQTVRQDFYITDGAVSAEVLSGNTLYIGGSFTLVGPATGGFVPVDTATALPSSGFPKVAGTIYSVVSDGSGGWYVGGSFTGVGGIPRRNLARILSNNTVSSWDPSPNGAVYSLALSGTTLYAGGEFTSVGGQTRNYLAALSTSSGLATAWNPNGNAFVYAMVVGSSTVYVGGDFTNIGGGVRGC